MDFKIKETKLINLEYIKGVNEFKATRRQSTRQLVHLYTRYRKYKIISIKP
jgi:hypothetical protein